MESGWMAGLKARRGVEITRVPDRLARSVSLWSRKGAESRVMCRFSTWATGWSCRSAGVSIWGWTKLFSGCERALV